MSQNILPVHFSDVDFGSWLQHFKLCALANSWDAEKRPAMSPPFLQGPAGTFYESMPAGQKDTFPHLSENLLTCFTPLADKKSHYHESGHRKTLLCFCGE